jgi:hypothetical protein
MQRGIKKHSYKVSILNRQKIYPDTEDLNY